MSPTCLTLVGRLLSFFLLTCDPKKVAVTNSDQTDQVSRHPGRLESTWDPQFEPHLFGWRSAEAHYQEVLGASSDPRVLDRLLSTQFLILRQHLAGSPRQFSLHTSRKKCQGVSSSPSQGEIEQSR